MTPFFMRWASFIIDIFSRYKYRHFSPTPAASAEGDTERIKFFIASFR